MLLSKDENDAKRTSGVYLARGNVKQAVLDLADLRRVFEQIVPIELWLAKKIFDWHNGMSLTEGIDACCADRQIFRRYAD